MGKHFAKNEKNKKNPLIRIGIYLCVLDLFLNYIPVNIESNNVDEDKLKGRLRVVAEATMDVNKSVQYAARTKEFTLDTVGKTSTFYIELADNISKKMEEYNEIEAEKAAERKKQEEKALAYEGYLKEYAKYYHFDSNKVIEIARRLTNDYEMDFSEVNGTTLYDLENPEAAVLTFMYQLKSGNLNATDEEIGYTIDDLLLDYNMETLNGSTVLPNGVPISDFIGHVCDLLNLDKVLVYAISSGETGWQGSELAQYANNFGGMTPDGGNYLGFQTPQSGVIAFVENLNLYYFGEGLTTLEAIASKYCPGNPGYVDFIYDVMHDVKEDYDRFFPSDGNSLTLTK